ncbi:MAG: hypothetical protein ACP5EP_02125 [Acidobacteriaceae bacterium]
MPPSNPYMMLIFVAATAAGVLLQACVLLAIYFAVRSSERKATEKIDEIRKDITPLLRSARALVENAQALLKHTDPKVRAITDNLLATSEHVRDQADNMNAAVAEITLRTRNQVQRVDGMVTEVLDAIAHGTRLVRDSILPPLRQMGGWLHAARAVLDTLRRPEVRPRKND